MGESQSLSNFSEGGVAPTELPATTPKSTEKEATGTSEARQRDGIFPMADLEPQSIDDRDHSHWDALLKTTRPRTWSCSRSAH